MSVPISSSTIRKNRQPLGYVPDDAQPSILTPRRSLVNQRNAACKQYAACPPASANVVEDEDMRDTDDLSLIEEELITNPAKINPRTRRVPISPQTQHRQRFPWLRVCFGLIALALAVWMIVQIVLAVVDFCTDTYNTYHYGPTRMTIVSGVFGHDDSPANPTSVIAINLNGTLLIETVPGGNVSKAKVYSTGLALVGDTAAKIPILLTIKDLNGKPDVLIEIPDQSITLKLMNTGSDFVLVE